MVELQVSSTDTSPTDAPAEDDDDDDVPVKETDVLRGSEMLRHNSGPLGSIVLVVRRPG